MATQKPVTLSLNSLGDPSIGPLVTEAFSSSPTSLGIAIIKDLPSEFATLRQNVLRASERFGRLPEETREKYADAKTRYSFGWSKGKEIMNGKPDNLKGSYYANPTSDVSPSENGLSRNNVWPSAADCPGFEDAFKAMCLFLVGVGGQVAGACDGILEEERKQKGGPGLASERTIKSLIVGSQACKARLLHYFAPEGQTFLLDAAAVEGPEEPLKAEDIDDSWCGVHVDHGLLTALCPALYLFHPLDKDGEPIPGLEEPLEIPTPSREAGLYIKTRSGDVVRAGIPNNCIAFQTGATLSQLSWNSLAGTPHFVRPSSATDGNLRLSPAAFAVVQAHKSSNAAWAKVEKGRVTRETMAVFLQPDRDVKIGAETGETFGEFSNRIVAGHYKNE